MHPRYWDEALLPGAHDDQDRSSVHPGGSLKSLRKTPENTGTSERVDGILADTWADAIPGEAAA